MFFTYDEEERFTALLSTLDSSADINLNDLLLLYEGRNKKSVSKGQNNMIKSLVGKFFSKTNKINFIEQFILLGISSRFDSTFWEILSIYKTYLSLTSEDIDNLLKSRNINLSYFKYKKIVEQFPEQSANELNKDDISRKRNYSIKILHENKDFHLPYLFNQNDFDKMLQYQLDTGQYDMLFLSLLINPLKKIYNNLIVSTYIMDHAKALIIAAHEDPNNFPGGILKVNKEEILLSISPSQDELILHSKNKLTLSTKWMPVYFENLNDTEKQAVLTNIEETLGLLQNGVIRSQLQLNNPESPLLEMLSTPKGKNQFNHGYKPAQTDKESSLILYALYFTLSFRNIPIEKVLSWFFETRLPLLGIENLSVSFPLENDSFLNKCKIVAPEIENILKQWDDFVQNGDINHSRSANSSIKAFAEYKSMIKDKYFKFSPPPDFKASFEGIFNRNSSLIPPSLYTQNGEFYLPIVDCLYDGFQKTGSIPFYGHNSELINDSPFLQQNELGFVEIIPEKKEELHLLNILYNSPILISTILDSFPNQEIIEVYKKMGYIKPIDRGHFFSNIEANYLDYLLKSGYSNGLEIRNKYAHGTYHEENHEINYMTLLNIVIIIIQKIEQEFLILNNY